MIPLTVRSYYSLMWGTRSPKQICAAAKQRGYNRLALTDTDNLYGLWPFLKSCKQEGITPIVGAELTDPISVHRAVCLVENNTGYRNLCRLITRRHSDKTFDLKSAVLTRAEGLVVITQAAELLTDWHDAGITVAAAAPRKPVGAAWRLRQVSQHLGVPMVATPGSFFLDPDDFSIHRMLRAIDLNTSLSQLTCTDVAPFDAWLAPASEYAGRFHIWPDSVRATEVIAERLTFTGPDHGLVLPLWTDGKGHAAEYLLRQAAYEGARRRYGNDLPEPVVDRLEHELRIIKKMQFSSYFLVVQDIVSRSPRICGWGSGAASLVAYSLGITNVCPIKYNLYFERFLNPGRSDPPDIDIDFAWDERDDVLRSVLTQYNGHAALVCNHVAFQPRMAIREVAKVYGLTNREIGQVSKRLPWFWRATRTEEDLLTRLKQLPELGEIDFPEPWPLIIHTAQRIIGIPRHLSVHPGGVVITPNPLDNYVPVEPAPKGVPIIQWEKDAAEDSGLVKIDLLGNRSLGVIRDAIQTSGAMVFFLMKRTGNRKTIRPRSSVWPEGTRWAVFTSKALPHACFRKRRRSAILSIWSSTAASSGRPPTHLSANTCVGCTAGRGNRSIPCWPMCSMKPMASWSFRKTFPKPQSPWPGFHTLTPTVFEKSCPRKTRAENWMIIKNNLRQARVCAVLPTNRSRLSGI